jgi:ribulose bisphosphate carboxylase small subunit
VWNFTLEGSADGERWRRLARHRGGEPAIRYSDDVAGRFRFLRLRVQGSAEGHLPSSRGLKIIGVGSPVRAPWQRVAPVKRFFPKQYQIRFTEITAQLDELKRQGYAAIELAGFKEGPAAEFGGLGATDNFAVASELGTMADFDELMDTAEQKGIRVVLFDNLGYTHITSPLFKRAVRDFQQGKKTRATEHFVFRNSNEGERWYQYPGTKVWYYGFWGERLPSYNWETQTWRNEATKIIRFWMDKGADGIGLDAPAVYWGFTRELNNRYITDTLANYNASRMIEGIQATYDDTVQVEYQRMVTEWGYNTIQDLSINFWGDPSRNKIVPAIEAGDPSELDLAFTLSRDAVTAVGGIQLEAPGWEADLTDGKPDPDKVVPAGHRLLEIATLSSSGSMFYITNGYHLYRPEEQTIANWEPEERAQLDRILRAVNTDQSLHPAGGRIQVPTNDDRRFYAYLRTDPTGGVTSLVILNYQKTRQPITVELTGTGVAIGQQPIDLISSKPMPELDSTSYEVSVPGHGYREIGLR